MLGLKQHLPCQSIQQSSFLEQIMGNSPVIIKIVDVASLIRHSSEVVGGLVQFTNRLKRDQIISIIIMLGVFDNHVDYQGISTLLLFIYNTKS